MAWSIAAFTGLAPLRSAFSIVDWHVHELLFGYAGAVIAGFLLTAVPNWTRRLPVSGLRLLSLFSLWIAGRIAIAFSFDVNPLLIAAIDLAFPAWLAFVIARELIAGRNHRNLRVLVLVILFTACNAAFHYEAAISGTTDYSRRGGIAVVLVLIMLIGGRIIPSFTRNWLVQRRSASLPVPFGRFDGVAIAFSGLALGLWTIVPEDPATSVVLFLAGLLNIARLARWKGWSTAKEGLVSILHLAYAFIPAGMIALALSNLWPDLVPPTGALHLLTAGAVGMMTTAVMTRASLGHTGQQLHADRIILSIYGALALSVVMRFVYASEPKLMVLTLSAALWVLAFALFVWRYAYMAVR